MEPQNIDVEKLHKNHHLCSEHFEDSQFMNAANKNKLIHNAVPTIFNVPNPPKQVTLKRKIPEYHPRQDNTADKRKKKSKFLK